MSPRPGLKSHFSHIAQTTCVVDELVVGDRTRGASMLLLRLENLPQRAGQTTSPPCLCPRRPLRSRPPVVHAKAESLLLSRSGTNSTQVLVLGRSPSSGRWNSPTVPLGNYHLDAVEIGFGTPAFFAGFEALLCSHGRPRRRPRSCARAPARETRLYRRSVERTPGKQAGHGIKSDA